MSRVEAWLREQCQRQVGTSEPIRVVVSQLLQDDVLAATAAERDRHRDGDGRLMSTSPRLITNTEPYFVAVAEMVRLGIIAPVALQISGQLQFRDEYLITPRGVAWLMETEAEIVLPAELKRFDDELRRLTDRYGRVFYQRAREALDCFHAHCYYAACVMSGAAAEAILVAIAGAKVGDSEVQRRLKKRDGRADLLKLIRPERSSERQRRIELLTDLISYYRDDGAHVAGEPIDENRAEFALLSLLNVARFSHREWESLTAPPTTMEGEKPN